jgi:hypothetical protein
MTKAMLRISVAEAVAVGQSAIGQTLQRIMIERIIHQMFLPLNCISPWNRMNFCENDLYEFALKKALDEFVALPYIDWGPGEAQPVLCQTQKRIRLMNQTRVRSEDINVRRHSSSEQGITISNIQILPDILEVQARYVSTVAPTTP